MPNPIKISSPGRHAQGNAWAGLTRVCSYAEKHSQRNKHALYPLSSSICCNVQVAIWSGSLFRYVAALPHGLYLHLSFLSPAINNSLFQCLAHEKMGCRALNMHISREDHASLVGGLPAFRHPKPLAVIAGTLLWQPIWLLRCGFKIREPHRLGGYTIWPFRC